MDILAMFTSWKTTLAGIAVGATAIAKLANDASSGDFGSIGTDLMGIFAGLGFLVAKDSNVTNAAPTTQVSSTTVTARPR
jgi:hypothetical protein